MPFSNFPGGNGDHNFFTYLLIVILSLWGGLVNYLGRIRSGAVTRFNLVELVGEFTISAFAGLTIGLIAMSFKVDPLMVLALGGVAGHAGGRTVYFLDRIFESRLKSLTDSVNKKP